MTKKAFSFENLSLRHVGLTSATAASHEEAARVCLTRNGHISPKDMSIEDGVNTLTCIAHWNNADARSKRAWANIIDSIEAGAYAVALAAIELTRGLVAIRRAETKSGADYYVATPGGQPSDLESKSIFRLEVSGTDSSSESEIRSRMRRKRKQVRNGASDLPAIVSVVAFGSLKVVSLEIQE